MQIVHAVCAEMCGVDFKLSLGAPRTTQNSPWKTRERCAVGAVGPESLREQISFGLSSRSRVSEEGDPFYVPLKAHAADVGQDVAFMDGGLGSADSDSEDDIPIGQRLKK